MSMPSNLDEEIPSAIQNTCVPDLAALLNASQKSIHSSEIKSDVNLTNSTISSYTPSSGYIPDLAALDIIPRTLKEDLRSEEQNININDSQYTDNSFRLPNLSELNISRSYLDNLQSNTLPSNISSDIICYSYKLLEKYTNNFNDDLYGHSNGSRLGSGAFGTIYFAQGLTPNPLAVKKLHKMDTDNIRLFNNEIEIMSNHHHDNLLKLLGYSIDGPTYCLIYEYMSGGSLQERLKCDDVNQNDLCANSRVQIAIGCAKGISYLHNIPIIHRDIKSANILLNQTNQPKVIF